MKLFVINGRAGKTRKLDLYSIIRSNIDVNTEYKLLFWDNNNSSNIFNQISEYLKIGCEFVIAAGGDGTVNAIASMLKGSNTTMGIIPLGSGNGLARHLGIPMDIPKAIKRINNPNIISIDSCTINDKNFFCTSGVGFDAHISERFAKSNKRGFNSYARITISEFNKYKPQKYEIIIDEKRIKTNAFIVTFANANQWGNNFFIAPNANIQDGIIDVTIIKEVNIFSAIKMIKRLREKKILDSRYVENFRGKNIILRSESILKAHVDGEPIILGNEISVNIKQKTLKVMI